MSGRRERLAKNEALFRDVNERVEQIATAHAEPEQVEFLCECVELDCLERIGVPLAEYERIRGDAAQFVVKPGHERPDLEEVVRAENEYVVVRKHPDTRPIVEERDPRS